ncbi:MAG: LamG domain-containing protein, partial [Halobacteriaceae archaeon]
MSTNEELLFRAYDGSEYEVNTGTTFSTGEWNMVAATYNGAKDKQKVYANGELVKSGSFSVQPASSGDYFIGAFDSQGTPSGHFNGKIDDVRIYNTSLTTEEVRSAMTSPKTPFASWQSRGGQDLKPLAHWTFDEGRGEEVYDRAGSFDGVVGTSKNSEAHDPSWTAECRYRDCLHYDGNGRVSVNVSHNGELDLTGHDFTLSTWFKTSRTTGTNNDYQGLLVWDTNDAAGLWTYQDSISYYDSSSSSSRMVTGGSYSTGEWHHAVAVRRDDSEFDLWLDGKHVGSTSESPGGSHSPTEFFIGNRGDADRPLKGDIDDARVYNRSLSNSSIHALYNAPSSSWSSTSVQVRT